MTTNTLTTAQRSTLRDDLTEAKYHLRDAISLIANYVTQTGDHEAEAYIVDQLKIIAGRDHDFLAGDLNLDDLLERLDETEPADDTDEADDDLPDIKTVGERTLYLLRNNLGPICNEWGEPVYVTIPTD